MARVSLSQLSFDVAPKITGELPGPKSKKLLDKQTELEGGAVSYPRGAPVAFGQAYGATIKDVDGNVFIDFFGGAGVLNVGHCNPDVVEAVKTQVESLTHSLDFPTQSRIDLVEQMMLIAPAGLKNSSKVLFGGPTGSDAVESSIKLAKQNTRRQNMIAFEGSYHGMTTGALACCSGKKFKENYLPLAPEVHFTPYAYCYRCVFGMEYPDCGIKCADYLEHILKDPHSGVVDPAAIIVEPVQGEGGSIAPPPDFISRVRQLSKDYSILLICDEIQAGLGRTGKMWSCEHSGITPDIMTISKGIGGGLPLSAIMYNKSLDIWKPGAHIGTFRGNVLAMAAGSAALKFMKEYDLPKHSAELGKIMLKSMKELEERHYVGEVRGSGLMIGIEFVKNKKTKEPFTEMAQNVRLECYKHGVLVELGGHYNNVIRFLPPLVLTRELAEKGLNVVSDVIKSLENQSTK
jgi:diaminobutyrate-2-oxoglutarate transaminase